MSYSYLCRICKEPMKRYVVHVLECLHEFHKACIENWMEGTRDCPSCMGYLDSDSSDSEEQPSNAKLQDSTVDSSTVLPTEPNESASNVFWMGCISSSSETDSEDLYNDEDMPGDEEPQNSTIDSCTVPPNADNPNGDSTIAMAVDPSDDEELICPICTEALTTDVTYLCCDHAFHPGCIENWMECSTYCPSCMG